MVAVAERGPLNRTSRGVCTKHKKGIDELPSSSPSQGGGISMVSSLHLPASIRKMVSNEEGLG